MVADTHPGSWVGAMARSGKHPEPLPSERSRRIFLPQLKRKWDTNIWRIDAVLVPNLARLCDLRPERIKARRRDWNSTILATLRGANKQLAFVQKNILHTKLQGFGDPKAAAIEQVDQEAGWGVVTVDHCGSEDLDLLPGGCGAFVSWSFGAQCVDVTKRLIQHIFVEKQQGRECLILGSCRYLSH